MPTNTRKRASERWIHTSNVGNAQDPYTAPLDDLLGRKRHRLRGYSGHRTVRDIVLIMRTELRAMLRGDLCC